MTSDRFIRALREDPTIFSSMQLWIAERKEKALVNLALANSKRDIYRLQGEVRALTNIVLFCKNELGALSNARTGTKRAG